MIDWLRRMLGHRATDRVVPANPDHARTLERADALLADPRIQRILSIRDREMKEAFARQGRRLGA